MFLQLCVFLAALNFVLASYSTDEYTFVSRLWHRIYTYDDIELEQIKGNLSLLQNITTDLIKRIDLQEQNFKQMMTLLSHINNKHNLNIQKINDLINASFDKINQQLMLQQEQSKKYFKALRAEFYPKDCTIALENNDDTNGGVYQIKIKNSNLEPFNVYCLRNSSNEKSAAITTTTTTTTTKSYTDWLLIQRRLDGSVDFYRNWIGYQEGFGNLDGEFFIGLNKLHALTKSRTHELWIQLENFEGEKRWAKYSNFRIGNESEGYKLKSLGTYTGNAGDSLAHQINQKWTTKDVDNDQNKNHNCAILYKGAWWYDDCHWCNLNGLYLHGAYQREQYAQGITWAIWLDNLYSLKYVHMAIRPIH